MIDELKLFRNASLGHDYIISDHVRIRHPTLGTICDVGEGEYYGMVTAITATPSSYKVPLDDIGVDYTTLSDFELFMMLSQGMTQETTASLLGDLDLSLLRQAKNLENDEVVLCAEKDGLPVAILDRAIYTEMTEYIRKIHGFEKKVEIPKDAHTKKYLIDKDRKRIKRQQNAPVKSMLQPLISGMVNQPGFKYDYATVWDLSIVTFTDAVSRVQKFLNYTQTMQGVYAGTISFKDADKRHLNWLE